MGEDNTVCNGWSSPLCVYIFMCVRVCVCACLCTRMFVCVHRVYMFVCVSLRMCVHICLCMFVHVCVCAPLYIHVCECMVCMCVCLCIFVHVCVCACLSMYTCVCSCIYMNVYIYAHVANMLPTELHPKSSFSSSKRVKEIQNKIEVQLTTFFRSEVLLSKNLRVEECIMHMRDACTWVSVHHAYMWRPEQNQAYPSITLISFYLGLPFPSPPPPSLPSL